MGTKYNGNTNETNALNAFIVLMRAANSITSRLNPAFLKIHLTPTQFGILETLYHLGPLCQKDIAQKQLKTGGNITMAVDHLEKKQLVVRSREKEDRRRIAVGLTKKGRDYISKVLPEIVSRINAEMSVLTQDEQQELRRLCRKLGIGRTTSSSTSDDTRLESQRSKENE